MVQLTIEQRIFIVSKYEETKSYLTVQKLFREKFPDREPPYKATIWKNVAKYRKNGTSLNLNKTNSGRRRTARTQENIEAVRKLLNESKPGDVITARKNPLGLSKSTFNSITRKDLGVHPPTKARKRSTTKNPTMARKDLGSKSTVSSRTRGNSRDNSDTSAVVQKTRKCLGGNPDTSIFNLTTGEDFAGGNPVTCMSNLRTKEHFGAESHLSSVFYSRTRDNLYANPTISRNDLRSNLMSAFNVNLQTRTGLGGNQVSTFNLQTRKDFASNPMSAFSLQIRNDLRRNHMDTINPITREAFGRNSMNTLNIQTRNGLGGNYMSTFNGSSRESFDRSPIQSPHFVPLFAPRVHFFPGQRQMFFQLP